MRSRFDEQLAQLERELIEMGALCEESIALAAKSLGDGRLARQVAPLDTEIDRKERDIESLCLKLLLQQQPVARDLRQISAALRRIPVVMATAKGAEYDKIQGLDLGADYYLAKPFGVMELVSCVKAVLRRCRTEQEPVLRAGGIVLHPEERIVTVEGQRVTLTYKEFELLRLFLSHPGMAFTRDQLFNEIWGMDYCGETRTVDMHIRTLRQKLGSCGSMIQTVRNVGYRLEVGA